MVSASRAMSTSEAVGVGAAVAFVEYDRSPEARYPVAIEQGYAVAQLIARGGRGPAGSGGVPRGRRPRTASEMRGTGHRLASWPMRPRRSWKNLGTRRTGRRGGVVEVAVPPAGTRSRSIHQGEAIMSVTRTRPAVVLEAASQEFVEATAKPPFLYELTPTEARAVLDDVQAAPIEKLQIQDHWMTVAAEVGDVALRIVRPPNSTGPLPVILYMHGGGWVLGNAGTHDRLVRELAVGVGAAVAFVEYDRSPEARYPVAIEQGYAVAQLIAREGAEHNLDPHRMAVAGDSVGGGMAAALALMAQDRGDVEFVHQSMYYPVTDAGMDTGSYEQFAEGYFLSAKSMAWFWDAYVPDLEQRSEPYASPLRAEDERLAGLPPAFVIVDEADVLRDEGEAYAGRLRAAGVDVTAVRYDGITHDFMMLNPLSETHATRAAVAQSIAVLRKALGTD
jgi:acetyl esterase